mmetsp:Transcript_29201/g.93691  ORF Transcript_29201/g.93691 Transcript_29201/m.93691 type:complete len:710 (+) Transcript_29201:159-2288(+)
MPLTELMGYVVTSVLEEMRGNPGDPQVQAMGVNMLRAMIKDSEALKRIVLAGGGVEVLVLGVQQHPTDEDLLTGALEAIDELHGLASLLQALDHLKASPPGARAGLWAFARAAKDRWAEVGALPHRETVRVILSTAHAHQDDYRVLSTALELLADLMMEVVDMRCAFSDLGGWPWLLQVMEANAHHGRIQLYGCKLLSALCRGGCLVEAHMSETVTVLERCFVQHEADECVLYWAFWAVQQLNGARALVNPMRNGCFKTASAMVAALKSLAAVTLGESDGACAEDMPAVVAAVVHAMDMFSERFDVLYEAMAVLGHVAVFVLGSSAGASVRQQLLPCVEVAVKALLHVMVTRSSDACSVQSACVALAGIIESCPEASPVRASIRAALLGGSGEGEHLLAKIIAAHVSNDSLQMALMWLNGIVVGVGPILQQMAQHSASHAVQLPAIRTLALLYGERIELEAADLASLPAALQSVLAAMRRFPENIVLQQHACYSLCAMTEHVADVPGSVSDEALSQCAVAAVEALRLVRGRCDGRQDSASYNALYLRKEGTRCIVAVCAMRPSLGRWLRESGLQDVLADALRSTADSVWDGRRDPEAEETLRLELLALSYVLGPPAILEALRRWGVVKPAVVRAAADAVVDLARGAMNRKLSDTPDPEMVAFAAPVQALIAAGCGAEFLAVMQVHAADEDLQSRIHLAVGFVGGCPPQL